MALAEAAAVAPSKGRKGRAEPRLHPPTPARSGLADFEATATEVGIDLFPWQKIAARYLTATGPGDRLLYPEVAIVVGRQNGKTRLLVPLIVSRLRAGRRVMHTAQNRNLPREVFDEVADIMAQDLTLFPTRNGRPRQPRFANGQEEIVLSNGGSYRLVAPTRGGARGPSNDLVIVDELREMDTLDFIGAAKPTLSASPDPQIVYLSNAGTDDSIVLNGVRLRADSDPNLAYLEWSAAPERPSDDREGWREANPSIGYLPRKLENLEREYLSSKLEGTLALFEVEYLCRWVPTLRERLVDAYAWAVCEAQALTTPTRSVMGISMDPDGTRASAVLSWQQPDGTVAMQLIYDVRGSPIDTDALGADLRDAARKAGVSVVGFDPLTDAELAKFFKKTEAVSGGKFANASARFVTAVLANKLRWHDAEAVSDDLVWTSRKPHDESGSYQAVRAQDDRPITASLAAIRAVWLASGPRRARPRIY